MYDFKMMIDRIKMIKKEKNLTNRELSNLSGVPFGTLNKILGSETKDPAISAIIKIAECLETSADYLIFGTINSNYSQLIDIDKKFINDFNKLNKHGQEKASEYISDLVEVEKYKKSNQKNDIKKQFEYIQEKTKLHNITEIEIAEELGDLSKSLTEEIIKNKAKTMD